ncbi:MAG: helix-turn-helix transcriptional regulator [Candidatus Limnocylindrales bacterium]
MTARARRFEPISAIASLGAPARRRLYEYVVAQAEAVSRDDAAAALGMGRPLAAFHLDRLARSGLLEVEYRRLSGRTGPGAGRPAKLYRRASGTLEVSLPRRRYALAADLFAAALERLEPATPPGALLDAARTFGLGLGGQAVRSNRPTPGGPRSAAPPSSPLVAVLREAGFEPEASPGGPDGELIRLRNCPFDALAKDHRGLTCAMNRALLEGVLAGLGETGLVPETASTPGYCCVAFRAAQRPSGEIAAGRPGGR